MGGNLPPGAAGDPNAPWNQPDISDLLPLVCESCGFVARTVEDLADHEHPEDHFVQPPRHDADRDPGDRGSEPPEPPKPDCLERDESDD